MKSEQLPNDMRHFRADPLITRQLEFNCICIIILVALLAWMGNRDAHKVEQLKQASVAQCHQHHPTGISKI